MVATTHATPAHATLLTATFYNPEDAERAYNALISRGYAKDEISVLMSKDTREQHFSKEIHDTKLGNKAAKGGATGAAIGGVAGVIAGILAAAGTIVLPGLGLIVAGPLVAGLAGLGAGGAAGGLIGALVGAGIPEERAKAYEADIKRGGIVLGVRPHSEEDAEAIEREWATIYRGQNVFR